MIQHEIRIIDRGFNRYIIDANEYVLGRMFDNKAESIIVHFPQAEINRSCKMIVSVDGFIVDKINVENCVEIPIKKDLSSYPIICVGFNFYDATGYEKNSEIKQFQFLKAHDKDGINAIYYELKEKIDNIVIRQAQSDLAEDDDTVDAFVKGKKTSNLANDGADGISPYASEKFVTDKIAEINIPEMPSIPEAPDLTGYATEQYVNNSVYNSIGIEQQIDYNAVLQEDEIIASLDESVSDFELKQNTAYLFHIYLPLVTLTGDLNDNYTLFLTDKNGNRVHLNCMYEKDITKTSTVGDFCQIQDYDVGIGYSWEFNGHYREVNDGGVVRRVVYVDTITRETNPSMTGENLHNAVINSKLKVGTTVLCTAEYAINGHSYIAGHTYKVNGEWVDSELMLDTVDLTAETGDTVKALTYDDTTLGEHITEILGHINSENFGFFNIGRL